MGLTDLETSVKCDGKCGDPLDLMKAHLVVVLKVQKQTLVVPPQPARTDDETVEDDEENQVVMGIRSGVGEQLRFHTNECAAKYFTDTKSRVLRLKLNTDDSDPYEEGSEIMHGSDEKGGDEE